MKMKSTQSLAASETMETFEDCPAELDRGCHHIFGHEALYGQHIRHSVPTRVRSIKSPTLISTTSSLTTHSSIKELPTSIDYFGAIEELRKSGLQWTVVLNGCFLDYCAIPHLESYLRPAPFAVEIAERKAAIPGDGNRVSFTFSFDVARFVVGLLDLDVWLEESRIAGDTHTWNGFVLLAEEKLGLKLSSALEPRSVAANECQVPSSSSPTTALTGLKIRR
jgi:hypothetical protein